jgi:hypothetical protein
MDGANLLLSGVWNAHLHLTSVIIRHLNIVRITVDEPEANAPLVVDGDGVLSFSIACKFVEPIPWRNPKVIQAHC